MKEGTFKAGLFIITVLVSLAIALGLISLMWLGWTWAIPQVWPTGPEKFIKPDYWLFVVLWMIFVTLLKVVRGGH